MRPQIDIKKINQLPTAKQLLIDKYGEEGTAQREEFDAKACAWYYTEVLKTARKQAGITQQQLADKVGKKREYISPRFK